MREGEASRPRSSVQGVGELVQLFETGPCLVWPVQLGEHQSEAAQVPEQRARACRTQELDSFAQVTFCVHEPPLEITLEAAVRAEIGPRFGAGKAIDMLSLQGKEPLRFVPPSALGIVERKPGVHVSQQKWVLRALGQFRSQDGHLMRAVKLAAPRIHVRQIAADLGPQRRLIQILRQTKRTLQ